MKKAVFLGLLIAAVASTGLAQTGSTTDSFVFTPSTNSVAPNSTFTVQVAISGSDANPAALGGWDLWMVTDAANSGLFSITGVTYASGFTFAGSPPTVPDAINQPAASGFVRNSGDLGGISSGTDPAPPFSNMLLETLTISAGNITPGTPYTFSSSTTTTANSFYSDFANSNGDTFTTPQTSFTISAVPEPATWSLLVLGGLGSLGTARILRRRRA